MQVRNFIERKLIIGGGALGVLGLGAAAMVMTTGAASASTTPVPAPNTAVQQNLDVQSGLNTAVGSQTAPDTGISAEKPGVAEATTAETGTEPAAKGPDTDNIQSGGGAQTQSGGVDTGVPGAGN